MVQQQHQQQQPEQPPEERQTPDDDEEEEEEPQEDSSTLQHRSRRPLYRRVFNYVREAWTGVKFALGKQYYQHTNIIKHFVIELTK